jgi:hypothetical protein
MRARIDRYLINPPLRLLLPLLVLMFFVFWLVFALTTHYGVGGSAVLSAGCCVGSLLGALLRRVFSHR